MAKKIFISYSGPVAEELAEVLKRSIEGLFNPEPTNPKVEVSVASRSNFTGEFQDQIEEQLLESDFVLMLFTPHNQVLKGHWQMYEAGFFRGVEKAKEIIQQRRLISYAFCSYVNDVAAPVARCNAYRYKYNGKDENLTKSRYLNDMMKAIAGALELGLTDVQIENTLRTMWVGGLHNDLARLAEEVITTRPLSSAERVAQTKSNAHVDASVFGTKEQLMYTSPFGNEVHGYTPKTLESYFDTILRNFIPRNCVQEPDKFKDENGNVEEAHRVIIGNTRISTFVAFTDGENILLFDRTKAKGKTNVTNNRYDVFGSVQFENKTIKRKITSVSFLDKPIKELKPIYGAAFEDNHDFANADNKEVAVMFGVFAVMSKKDLQSALENNDDGALFIISIDKANNMKHEDFTSKAYLSIKQLSDLQKRR